MDILGVLKELRERRAILAERIVSGQCDDYEMYASNVGLVQGYSNAIALLEESIKSTIQLQEEGDTFV